MASNDQTKAEMMALQVIWDLTVVVRSALDGKPTLVHMTIGQTKPG